MSQNLTLQTRLKILVAKTFRAEKLYGSIRNDPSGQSVHLTTLAEIANDIRAREWQRSHFQFRTALNDLLSEAGPANLSAAVLELQRAFQAKATESTQAMQAGTAGMIDATKRFEFAHGMKLAVELIRQRARAQANQVIADELAAVLDAAGGSTKERIDAAPKRTREASAADVSAEFSEPALEEQRHSNVIPLSRKVASGRASRR